MTHAYRQPPRLEARYFNIIRDSDFTHKGNKIRTIRLEAMSAQLRRQTRSGCTYPTRKRTSAHTRDPPDVRLGTEDDRIPEAFQINLAGAQTIMCSPHVNNGLTQELYLRVLLVC